MVKNNKEINSKQAVEGTLCKMFGFKKEVVEDGYWLKLQIKCKDFNVFIYVEDLNSIFVEIETKSGQDSIEIIHSRYSFNRLKQLVNRYKALK